MTAPGAVLKAVLALHIVVLVAACATPGEKPFKAQVVPVDEAAEDALGDWNVRDPIERLLLPATSDVT